MAKRDGKPDGKGAKPVDPFAAFDGVPPDQSPDEVDATRPVLRRDTSELLPGFEDENFEADALLPETRDRTNPEARAPKRPLAAAADRTDPESREPQRPSRVDATSVGVQLPDLSAPPRKKGPPPADDRTSVGALPREERDAEPPPPGRWDRTDPRKSAPSIPDDDEGTSVGVEPPAPSQRARGDANARTQALPSMADLPSSPSVARPKGAPESASLRTQAMPSMADAPPPGKSRDGANARTQAMPSMADAPAPPPVPARRSEGANVRTQAMPSMADAPAPPSPAKKIDANARTQALPSMADAPSAPPVSSKKGDLANARTQALPSMADLPPSRAETRAQLPAVVKPAPVPSARQSVAERTTAPLPVPDENFDEPPPPRSGAAPASEETVPLESSAAGRGDGGDRSREHVSPGAGGRLAQKVTSELEAAPAPSPLPKMRAKASTPVPAAKTGGAPERPRGDLRPDDAPEGPMTRSLDLSQLPLEPALRNRLFVAASVGALLLLGFIYLLSGRVEQPARAFLERAYPYGFSGATGPRGERAPPANEVVFTYKNPVSCTKHGEADCLLYVYASNRAGDRFEGSMVVKKNEDGTWSRIGDEGMPFRMP